MRESDETSGEMNTREAKPCEGEEALLLRHRLKANFGFSFFFLSPIIQIILTSEEISILELGTRWNSFIFFFFFGDELAVIPFFYDFRTLSRRNNSR